MDMHDTDCIEHSGDEMMFDSPIRPSIEIDDSPSLRGGVLFRPPHLAWVKKATLASPKERGKKQKAKADSGGLEGAFDGDADSISSDWDGYGDLPLTLGEYEATVARLEGSDEWNADQKKLHKLIYMRGLHPMMPSWWRLDFKMWGVTQPHLDDVFTPKHSKKRVAIHAYGHEVAGKHQPPFHTRPASSTRH